MPTDAVTRAQIGHVYAAVERELGLNATALCESAALAVAQEVQALLRASGGTDVAVLAGGSGNGADAIATARRLAGWGIRTTILLAAERTELATTTRNELERAEHYGIRIFDPGAFMPPAAIVVDGLIGTGLDGAPTDTAGSLIDAALRMRVPIVAIDLPSGLHPDTGKADQPAIRADVTVTLAYPKLGLVKPFAKNLVGTLKIADLSIPASAWQRLNLPAPRLTDLTTTL
ncbi:MAG: NAD(P)H-hydrate epimerase [Patescibacteria group bacterium]|jgi:hydroxyethylthiazole kinase-like uncharacterized protein yjeF